MPYNGSGTFSPYTPGNPVVPGTVISSTAFNATQSDIAAGLTNAVTRDGQSPPSANLPMGGRKLTGLGAGTIAGDSLRWEQLFSQGTEQDLASAATTDVGAQNTTILRITGTTGITSFGTNYNGPRFVRFADVLTLTHSAALVLPTSANITTAAGDRAILTPIGNPATGWQVLAYQRANGGALNGVLAGAVTTSGLTMATARGLGRLTGGVGAVEELTSAQWTASLIDAATDTAAGKIEIATAAEAAARTGTFAITPANFADANNVTVATVATTAGTTVAITTAAPSWAKKLRLILRSGSTNGTDNWLVQIGSGGLTTTGYGGAGSRSSGAAVAVTGSTAGLLLNIAAANSSINGEILITRGDANEYIISATLADGVNAAVYSSATGVSLAGVLTHVSITTTGGANTFDAGTAVLRAE